MKSLFCLPAPREREQGMLQKPMVEGRQFAMTCRQTSKKKERYKWSIGTVQES
jgi:hypothetical protein